MRWVKSILSLAALGVALWFLNASHGLVPPFGKLLNPFAGFWQNNEKVDRIPRTISVPGLKRPVQIVWDDRRVPHIFAENEPDLYRAQGYLTARDRLWQMDFIARFAGGRLSEIVGARALAQDRFERRIGMVFAAENTVKAMDKNAGENALLRAYIEGINAFIHSLKRKDWPLEYKILDYAPEPWTEMKSALLLKYMAYDLTFENLDARMSRTRVALGEGTMDRLFPFYPPFMDPIIPAGTRWDSKPAPSASSPSSPALPPQKHTGLRNSLDDVIGSNNWAVSGGKTRSGHPILSNDPHLALSLPSIWYEIQLSAPGLNVRGVSLPGAPGVIIGFNERIAWGLTNAGSDVLDWYKIQFKDATHREYFYDGAWKPTWVRREEIKVRGGKTEIDDIIYTHQGPIPYLENESPPDSQIPAGAALRWAAHDPSTAMSAILKLNRAKNFEDFCEAIRSFDCPAQNFIYADTVGNIAIRHNGKFPIRRRGQGRYVLDGTTSADEWGACVPWEYLPHLENPERGFVSSANQNPTDPTYPYYLGWSYASFERGARINQLLASMSQITPEDMIRMQIDSTSVRARTILPTLTGLLATDGLNDTERRCYDELRKWDYVNRAEAAAPTIFDRFWREVLNWIWADEFRRDGRDYQMPGSDVTMDMILHEPDSSFMDDQTTPVRETLSDIVRQAFASAVKNLEKELGPFGKNWASGRVRGTQIRHLAKIPGLGTPFLETSGGPNTINNMSRTSGPSWRMVVALGREVRAWGILPGGESGCPGSRYYETGIGDWMTGRAPELVFLRGPNETHPRLVGKTEMRGDR